MQNLKAFEGKAWKFGKNIDTDVIAACCLNTSKGEILAKYIMEDVHADFAKIIKKGDFVIVRELIANAI